MNTTPHKIQIVSEELLSRLFAKYFAGLCIFARQYVFDNDKVKDIVHDVFINIWEKGELYEEEVLIKSYLFTSVKNRCFNFLRDNKKFSSHEDYMDYDSAISTPQPMETNELEAIIKKEIENLPDKCREVFMMSRFEEKKYSDIALQLDISVKTVEAHMSKALKILRENLSPYLELILFYIILRKFLS